MHGINGDSDKQFFQQSQIAMDFYAHSIEGKPVNEWHRLEAHLKGTAASGVENE